MVAIIGVISNYGKYTATRVGYDNKTKLFASGNLPKDFDDATLFGYQNAGIVLLSSSVDDFVLENYQEYEWYEDDIGIERIKLRTNKIEDTL